MITALLAVSCSSTLQASKAGRAFTLGSGTGYEALCASGDLQRVLLDSALAPELKADLTQYLCSGERSPEKARHLYSSMTDGQQKDLLRSFKRQGYDLSTACG